MKIQLGLAIFSEAGKNGKHLVGIDQSSGGYPYMTHDDFHVFLPSLRAGKS